MKAIHNAVIQNELAKEKARRQTIQMEAVDQQMARLARAIVETAETQIQQARSFHRQQATAFDTTMGVAPGSLARQGIGQSNLRPMIAESLPVIQDIPGAQKPVRYADHARQQNALAMERAQRDAMHTQQRYYEEQARQERIRRNWEQYERRQARQEKERQQALSQPVKVFPQSQAIQAPIYPQFLQTEINRVIDDLISKIDRGIEGLLGIMLPQRAYQEIQQGNFSLVKGKKISKYYTWEDVFISTSINPKNVNSIPLHVYENAYRHAEVLDRIADTVGQKIPIESWVRIQKKSSYHTLGFATDYKGSQSLLHGPVYLAARKIQGLGIGKSNSPIFVGLHIDSPGVFGLDPQNRPLLPGKQFEFVDNGYYVPGTFKIQNVLP